MSVLKNIGFDEVLSRLGLTEAQVKVIYKGDIDKLQKQEKVLLESIDRMAKKTEEQYKERQKLSQAMDAERLAVENGKQELLVIRKEIADARTALEREKQDLTALHVRLNDAKEIFRQERVAYSDRMLKLEANEKAFYKTSADILQKDKDLDNLKDELYLKILELDQRLEDTKKLQEKIASDKNELLSLKLLVDNAKQSSEAQAKENEAVKLSLERLMLDAKDQITKDKESFYEEKRATEESLRKREVEVAKKEKFVDETEASIRQKLDEVVIEEGRRKKK
jgi:hypothetical protein